MLGSGLESIFKPFQSGQEAPRGSINDPNIVSPLTGKKLRLEADALISCDGKKSYRIKDGILQLFVEEAEGTPEGLSRKAVTRNVQAFYEDAPFPNYNDFDSLEYFLNRADEGVFGRLLSEQIPMNAKVAEVGCGTGQLSNYLAATTMAHIYAADMALPSLALGRQFAVKHKISGITFLQMNLFRPCIKQASMDIVISNGVLHHTPDTRRAFMKIASLVKPGGHLIVGLYNNIGRIRTDLRRFMYRNFGERILVLDPYLRADHSPAKRRAWIKDQYLHPQERKHSMSELLGWLEEAGYSFVSSIPKLCGSFSAKENLFKPTSPGTAIDCRGAEIDMIFSHGGEGGLFVMIGRRNVQDKLT